MRRTPTLLAMWLFVLVSPITTWLVIGDLSYKGDPDLDYMYHPIALTGGQRFAIAAAVIAVSAVAIPSFALACWRHVVRLADLEMALPVLLAGAYCGASWRMITAGVIGANIGGGMAMMFAPVFLLAMAVWFGFEVYEHRSAVDGPPPQQTTPGSPRPWYTGSGT